jgi:hypothetical protein
MGDSGRGDPGFEQSVAEAFTFLSEYGFTPIGCDEVSAHFESDCARLAIRYDCLSYELSLQLARTSHPDELAHPYGMQDLIRAVDQERASRYLDFAATSHDALARGLQQLAHDLKRYGGRALRCNSEFFAELHRERKRAAVELGRRARRANEDAAAREAFERQDWKRVIEIYTGQVGRLSRSEQKRLEIARRHAKTD